MKLVKPDFYDAFHCIADRCSDTCCGGWEIDVDDFSQECYRHGGGKLGKKLQENIVDGHFQLLPGDRCPFINSKNLCEIFTQLGEDSLCDICREHPRFVEVYGDVMERGLGLCCEEAVRLLFSNSLPLQFVESEIDEIEDELNDEEKRERDQIFEERRKIFQTLSDEKISFDARIEKVFPDAKNFRFFPFPNAENFEAFLSSLESFGSPWEIALKKINQKIAKEEISDAGYFTEAESVKLLSYLIYRHFAKSLYSGRKCGKLLFAFFFWNLARLFSNELAAVDTQSKNFTEKEIQKIKIDTVKILSKEFEYSEDVMEIVEAELEKFSGAAK